MCGCYIMPEYSVLGSFLAKSKRVSI